MIHAFAYIVKFQLNEGSHTTWKIIWQNVRMREITDLFLFSKLKIHCVIEELIKSMDYSAMNHKCTH